MKNENGEAVTTEEAARQKAVAKMKRVWVSQGYHPPEERLVVAEFNGFVWVIPIEPTNQYDRDDMRIFSKESTFETKFEAVSNQVKILRKLKDAEWYAMNELHALAPKSEKAL